MEALRVAENLTTPSEQVIVLTANLDCNHCRKRISRIVSRMNAGLLEYAVDTPNNEVVLRGLVDTEGRKNPKSPPCTSAAYLGFTCFGLRP